MEQQQEELAIKEVVLEEKLIEHQQQQQQLREQVRFWKEKFEELQQEPCVCPTPEPVSCPKCPHCPSCPICPTCPACPTLKTTASPTTVTPPECSCPKYETPKCPIVTCPTCAQCPTPADIICTTSKPESCPISNTTKLEDNLNDCITTVSKCKSAKTKSKNKLLQCAKNKEISLQSCENTISVNSKTYEISKTDLENMISDCTVNLDNQLNTTKLYKQRFNKKTRELQTCQQQRTTWKEKLISCTKSSRSLLVCNILVFITCVTLSSERLDNK